MDIGIRLLTTLALVFAMSFLHPPSVTVHIWHTHTYTHTQNQRSGDMLEDISWWRENEELVKQVAMYLVTHLHDWHHFPCFSFLPPSLGENNDGTSAAFEGWLNSTDSYGLWRVSGQVWVSPQLFKQLPVEGGCLSLLCYLSPEGPRGEG